MAAFSPDSDSPEFVKNPNFWREALPSDRRYQLELPVLTPLDKMRFGAETLCPPAQSAGVLTVLDLASEHLASAGPVNARHLVHAVNAAFADSRCPKTISDGADGEVVTQLISRIVEAALPTLFAETYLRELKELAG